MKANELMIGDYVIHPNYGKIQIKAIPNTDATYSPIPLTPEILEKNGWEHFYEKNTCGELHKWLKTDGFKQFTVWKNKGRFELGNLGCFPFKYVHELQHALRLCGLNEFADNLKI